MHDAKVFKLGNSQVITLPKPILDYLDVKKGERVVFVVRPDRRVEIQAEKYVKPSLFKPGET